MDDNIDDTAPAAQEGSETPSLARQAAQNPIQGPAEAEPPTLRETGPLTLREAVFVIAKHYGGAFKSLNFRFEPRVRDGGTIEFMATASNLVIAQAAVRTGPNPINDNNGNLFLPLTIHDVSYPRDLIPAIIQ